MAKEARAMPPQPNRARWLRGFALLLMLLASWPAGRAARLAAAPAGGAPTRLYGVTTANLLVQFTAAAPGTFDGSTAITGLQPAEVIRGIDVRPATGQLFALGSTSRLYLVNPATGAATLVGGGPFTPTLSATELGVDFNPVADRLRVVTAAEQNLRLNPATAAVVVDSALNPAGTVVAAAYDRNRLGAGATTLFGIDSAADQLVQIGGSDGVPSANNGVVTSLGPLGVDTGPLAGFDIAPGGQAYAALTVGGTPGLYTVNLATGAVTLIGTIGNGALAMRDIAVVLAPSVYLPLVSR
jgi:hypothetical protein